MPVVFLQLFKFENFRPMSIEFQGSADFGHTLSAVYVIPLLSGDVKKCKFWTGWSRFK